MIQNLIKTFILYNPKKDSTFKNEFVLKYNKKVFQDHTKAIEAIEDLVLSPDALKIIYNNLYFKDAQLMIVLLSAELNQDPFTNKAIYTWLLKNRALLAISLPEHIGCEKDDACLKNILTNSNTPATLLDNYLSNYCPWLRYNELSLETLMDAINKAINRAKTQKPLLKI